MLEHFADDPELENGMVDSSGVRAHACAAGASKNGGQDQQALGRSRGSLSTKIHVTIDLAFDHLLADRSYSAAAFVNELLARGIEVVIPPNKNTREPRAYDAWRYRERHLIECFIGKIKHFRRVFSQFNKLAGR
jgi:transposase